MNNSYKDREKVAFIQGFDFDNSKILSKKYHNLVVFSEPKLYNNVNINHIFKGEKSYTPVQSINSNNNSFVLNEHNIKLDSNKYGILSLTKESIKSRYFYTGALSNYNNDNLNNLSYIGINKFLQNDITTTSYDINDDYFLCIDSLEHNNKIQININKPNVIFEITYKTIEDFKLSNDENNEHNKTFENENEGLYNLITLNKGERLYIKNISITTTSNNINIYDNLVNIQSTGKFNLIGNLTLTSNDENNVERFTSNYNGITNIIPFLFCGSKIVDASKLILFNNLNSYIFCGLFKDCKFLEKIPELPKTSLSDYCYAYMFEGCTSLEEAPELFATLLTESCYEGMFSGCTSLSSAPILSAETLVTNCYKNMFNGCNKLKYIEALFTTDIIVVNENNIITYPYTSNWVNNVAKYGTFIKNDNWYITHFDENTNTYIINDGILGENGIPILWVNNENIPYNENTELDYKSQYLTIERTSIEPVELQWPANTTPNNHKSISYSYDKKNWNEIYSNKTNEIILNDQNNKVYLKGNDDLNDSYYDSSKGSLGIITSGSGTFKVYGNIISLFYDDFKNKIKFKENTNYNLRDFFKNTSVNDASNLILPCTTLTEGCYQSMFEGCTSLEIAPELPVETLTSHCYSNMFAGCTALTSAPILPATTLADSCYNCMFLNCFSLKTTPELPAETLAENCYFGMFDDCTALITAPTLPATNLNDSCYNSMFAGCTSLTTAPELPAETLSESCYAYMFSGCTSLEEAPELPATLLTEGCYEGMFSGCTALKKASKLPAETLVTNCYKNMFNGCINLNYIKALFITNPKENNNYPYTENWVNGVAEEGTFIKNNNNYYLYERGTSTIPINWNCEGNEPINYENEYLTIESLEDNNIICFGMTQGYSSEYAKTIDYSFDKINWNSVSSFNKNNSNGVGIYPPFRSSIITTLNKNEKIFLRGYNTDYFMRNNQNVGGGGVNKLYTSGKYNLMGNIMSLFYGKDFIGETSFKDTDTWPKLEEFFSNTDVVDASNLILPVKSLTMSCYQSMFENCKKLIAAPKLPATSLAQSCYQGMFMGCTSLTTAPDLLSTSLAVSCYQGMFGGCTNLVNIQEELPTGKLKGSLTNSCYEGMFSGCISLIKAPELPATILSDSCYKSMFYGCTSLTKAPELPTTSFSEPCYTYMFKGCNKLNYIKSLAKKGFIYYNNHVKQNAAENWVDGVAENGIFVISDNWSNYSDNDDYNYKKQIGPNGIPENWEIYSEFQYNNLNNSTNSNNSRAARLSIQNEEENSTNSNNIKNEENQIEYNNIKNYTHKYIISNITPTHAYILMPTEWENHLDIYIDDEKISRGHIFNIDDIIQLRKDILIDGCRYNFYKTFFTCKEITYKMSSI